MIKKITLFFFFLHNCLFASQDYELQLYETIFPAIFEKSNLKIYSDKKGVNTLRKSKIFETIKVCQDADLVVLGSLINLENSCQQKPIFVTEFKLIDSYDNVFGAFYWRKGRPQIRFFNKALESLHLKLPQNFQKYIDR